MRIVIIVLFFFIHYVSFSQERDSSQVVNKKRIDTVVIYQDPLLIRKTVYVNVPEEKEKKFYVSAVAGISSNKDYYNVCPNGDCQTYFDAIKKTTKPYINNTYELNLAYSPSSIYTELGIGYSIYRDKFTYADSNQVNYRTVNTYQYLDLNVSSGYWFNKNKHKVSFITLGGISASKLLSATGNTLSKDYQGRVVALTDQVHLYDYNYRINVKFKALYKLTKDLSAQVGISYSYDIRSIIKATDIYIRQRNIFGIALGGIYRF